jgi:hypothetical protein
MNNELEQLVEKWGPVLDYDGLSKISDSHKRAVTSVLLENQAKANADLLRREPTLSLTHLMEAAPTNSMGTSEAGTGNIDFQDPVLISLVRRTMPNLMAYDVCGVQPMTGPTGLIFALRSRYSAQDGIEALFNEANTTFGGSYAGNTASATAAGIQTGSDPSLLISSGNTAYTVGRGMSTAKMEALGTGAGLHFQEMAMSLEKIAVTAEGYGVKAEYTHELSQDLKATHGLDAEGELAKILSNEILAEINRQVIRSIYTTATVGAQQGGLAGAGYFDLDVDANGRWMEEKFKGLMFQIEREANEISKSTRAGRGNFIITSSDIASALNMVGIMKATDGPDLQVDDTGNVFAGTIAGRIKVFIDPYFTSNAGNNFIAVGYKGSSPFDAGLFYCPYVPLTMYRTQGENSFQPKIGFKTRYALAAHPFATTAADGKVHVNKKNKYYRIFAVKNLL